LVHGIYRSALNLRLEHFDLHSYREGFLFNAGFEGICRDSA